MPKMIQKSLRLNEELVQKIEKLAALDQYSFNGYVIKALTEYTNRDSDMFYELMSCIRELSRRVQKVERNQQLMQCRQRGHFNWLLPMLISYFEEKTGRTRGMLSDEDVITIVTGYEKNITLFNSYLKKKEARYQSEIEAEIADLNIEE